MSNNSKQLARAIKAQRMARGGLISAPASFKVASENDLARVCNGCGAANAKFDFVPDRIYGTSISAACAPHDWRYEEGQSDEDKREADREFLNNLLRIIERVKGWKKVLKPMMRRRALKYYEAVVAFGGPAFWAGKN